MRLTGSQWDTLHVLKSQVQHEMDVRSGGCLLREIQHPWLVRKYLFVFWQAMTELGHRKRETKEDRQRRLDFLSFVFQRQIESAKDLNHAEVVALLAICSADMTHDDMVGIWRQFER